MTLTQQSAVFNNFPPNPQKQFHHYRHIVGYHPDEREKNEEVEC